MKLRVLIADDEPLCRQRLRQFLDVEPLAEVVAECATGTEAVRSICETSPDVAFLDIKMPELDGFGVIKDLDGRPPAVIFVTAHDNFAIRAFEENAVDYLLKPFDQERFQTAFRRACERLQRGKTNLEPVLFKLPPGDGGKSTKPLERLTVRSGGRISILKTTDIDWISAADNYVELHVRERAHLVRLTLASLEARLPAQFMRISRSCLVNTSRLREVHSKPHGDFAVILYNGTGLHGTRNYRQGLKSLLGKPC